MLDRRSRLTALARRLLHRAGFDLVRGLDDERLLKQCIRLIHERHVEVVLDVGANTGQWAGALRAAGYAGRIVSFEPLTQAYFQLENYARRDKAWDVANVALGEHRGEAVLHVARNSQSSSMLEMLPAHLAADPGSKYLRDEGVELSTLSASIREHAPDGAPVFVKIDAQGYEPQILAGGIDVLDQVVGFQLELSLVPLYEGELLIEEMIASLRELEYVPTCFEPNFWDSRTGRLLQVDALFCRSRSERH